MLKEYEYLIVKKRMFPLAKHFLNVLFVVSISSFIFEKVYFNYEILEIHDYKAIYTFFVKGAFAIPVTIFFIVWVCTYFTATALFIGLNMALAFYVSKRTESIEQSLLDHLKSENKLEPGSPELTFEVPFKGAHTRKWYVVLLERLKSSYTEEEYKALLKEMGKLKTQQEDDFTILLRGMIAVTLYLTVISHFGWVLYAILFVVFIIYSATLCFTYQLLDYVPDIIGKVKVILKKDEQSSE